jgi:hypothetical protein
VVFAPVLSMSAREKVGGNVLVACVWVACVLAVVGVVTVFFFFM